MPAWTKETLLPPWPKVHDVKLSKADFYDSSRKEVADGADSLDRHRPLGPADRYGQQNRRAGTNGVNDDAEYADTGRPLKTQSYVTNGFSEDWREKLASPDFVVSVRDVKKASPE